jgi:hypothetical protein
MTASLSTNPEPAAWNRPLARLGLPGLGRGSRHNSAGQI